MDVPKEFMRAAKLLPPELRKKCLTVSEEIMEGAEELRLRVGQVPTAVVGGEEVPLIENRIVTPTDIQLSVEIATRASAHTYADSIRRGFVTAEGGCRLGLCGAAVMDEGKISVIRRMSSACIRIPREKQGCADGVFPGLFSDKGFESTLIVSPPGEGKTTLLRELVRLLSLDGSRVSLIDERSEVAAVFEGTPFFDVGPRTDILTGAPKALGIDLMLRAMSPQILAFDEITSPEDTEAAELAANCGVRLLATAHGGGVADLSERPFYRHLLDRHIFHRAVTIENRRGKRSYSVEELA